MQNLFVKIVYTLMLALMIDDSYAQNILVGEHSDIQKSRVGLVDEFLKRFNGEQSHPDISPKDSNFRSSNLLYLILPAQNIENRDSFYLEAEKFTNTVINNRVKLSFSDSTWIACAKCNGTLENKQICFNVYLNVEHRTNDMYKWVISRVEGECFDVTPRDMNGSIMLYPDDHETKFISLGRMTKEQPFNVERFMSKGSKYEATSVFEYLVNSKKLKIDYVDELEFIFTQVPGYIFTIKYFERNSSKTGWLINRFETISKEEKARYLKKINIGKNEQLSQTICDSDTNKDIEKKRFSKKNTVICSSHGNAEELFLSRIKERMSLLKNYFSLIQGEYPNKRREFYKEKLNNLFDVNSYVYINNPTTGMVKKQSISHFLEKIITRQVEVSTIDKITVPLWDNNLLNSKCDEIQLNTKIVPFIYNKTVYCEISDQLILTQKEETEDGIEWIPYFGNIYVTVQNTH